MPDQITQLKQAGFSDQEIGDWTTGFRSQMKQAGFNDDEISSYLGGTPNIPAKPPQAFLDRLMQGTGLASLWSHLESGQKKADAYSYIPGPDIFLRGATENFDTSAPHIFSEEYEKNLRDAGVISDPATGRAGPLRFAQEMFLRPIGVFGDLISRLGSAAVGGLAETLGETVKRMGGGEAAGEAAKREAQNLANAVMADTMARGVHVAGVGREPGTGRLIDLPLGGAARPEDFPAAAKTMVGNEASPEFQAKLQRLYEEKGLLPAEVAHDAASDVTVTQALASRGTDLPERYTRTAAPEVPPPVAREVEAPEAPAVPPRPAEAVAPEQSLEERRISDLREATDEENNLSTFKDGDTFRTSSGDIITLKSSGDRFQIRTGITLSAPFTPKGIGELLTQEGARRLIPRDEAAPPETVAPVPPPEPTGVAALPETIPSVIPNGIESIRPSDLAVDANRFQFKAGTDEAGVSDRLRDVTIWDPVKAGLSLVWEDENGQRFIVDGHQRLALAKRIAETDPAQNPRLNAIVIRAADGVTDTEARVIAASKNIAEGTGTPVDAAKILRDRPDLIKELPPRSELVRQARGLAELGDEPFGMIVNQVVPPAYGAMVGRLVPGDARLQGALIDLLNKTQPANAVQAEAIIRQGIAAGTRTETQATLFGDQDVVSSLYADRARVLDGALQQLRRDRLVFAAIVRDEEVVSAVGNRLETTANANRAAADAQAIQILQVLANRRGPLSDALTNAARRAAAGQRAAAVREFVDAIRQQAESGDLVRAADGLERGRADAGRQDAAQLVDPGAVAATARDTAAANNDAVRLLEQARAPTPTIGRTATELLQPTTTTADDIVARVPGAADRLAAVKQRLSDAAPTDAPVAQGGFKEPDGSWTPERAAIHDRILQDIFAPKAVVAATPQVGEKPTLHLLGGRGGSGKSWFLSPNGGVDRSTAIYLNADDIQAALPGYQGWNAALFHEEASEIGEAALRAARDRGLNVVLDATMRSTGSLFNRIDGFKRAGYRVDGHYMFAPPEVAAQRALERFMRGGETGRYVPPEYVLDSITNERSFDAAKDRFDNWEVYDNSSRQPALHSSSEQAGTDTAGALRQRPAVPADRHVAGLDVRPAEAISAEAEEPELKFGPETGAIQWGPAPPKTPLEAARDSILDKVSVGERPSGRTLRNTLDGLIKDWVDQFYPVSEVTPRGRPTEINPYRLARMMAGLGDRITFTLRRATLDFATLQPNGIGLEQVLAPVKDDLQGFRAFAVAAHALEMEAEGLTSGIDTGAARTYLRETVGKYGSVLEQLVGYQNRVAAYMRDAGVISRDAYDAMTQRWQLYIPFNRVIGDGDGYFGVGSSLQASDPLHRLRGSMRDIVDPLENVIRNTATYMTMAEKNVATAVLRDLLAGGGQIGARPGAPIALVPHVADPALDAALDQWLAAHGVPPPPPGVMNFFRAAGAQPLERGEIAVFDNGVRHVYQVDPELAEAWKGLDRYSAGLLERILAPLSRTLRAGAVLSPEFGLRHPYRDFFYAAITGQFTPLDMARGYAGMVAHYLDERLGIGGRLSEEYWNWMKSGGGNDSMVALDRNFLQEDLQKLTQQTGLMTRTWNLVVDPNATWLDQAGAIAGLPFKAASRYVLRPLQVFTAIAENATHLGKYIAVEREMMRAQPGVPLTREQILEAAWQSRDIAIDASQIGAKMRALNMISAFSNIVVRDSARWMRAFREDPLSTSIKTMAYITIPQMLLYLAQRNDPRYDEIPGWERILTVPILTDKWEDVGPAAQYGPPSPGSNYRVMGDRLQVNNGTIWRLPQPWSLGVIFGAGPVAVLRAFEQHSGRPLGDWLRGLADVSLLRFTPNAVTPIVEQFANRSLFTNRTLIPSNLEKMMPEYQYTPYTTETAKKLGQLIGAFPGVRSMAESPDALGGGVARALTTPILLENYIRGWGGGLGVYALQLTDLALRKEGLLPDPPRPASTLADIPFIKAFVIRYPTASAQSIQDFHDTYQYNKMHYDTWQAQAKAGDAVAAQRVAKLGGSMMFVQLDQIEKTLTEHSQLIQNIYKNPEMKPEEKRQLIDQAYYSMIQVAHAGNAMMRQADAILSGTH